MGPKWCIYKLGQARLRRVATCSYPTHSPLFPHFNETSRWQTLSWSHVARFNFHCRKSTQSTLSKSRYTNLVCSLGFVTRLWTLCVTIRVSNGSARCALVINNGLFAGRLLGSAVLFCGPSMAYLHFKFNRHGSHYRVFSGSIFSFIIDNKQHCCGVEGNIIKRRNMTYQSYN
jgi:hypothetical protein